MSRLLRRSALKAAVAARKLLFSANEPGVLLNCRLSEFARSWRRNLLNNSQRFTAWTYGSSNVTDNSEIAPDGTLTAATVNRPGGTSFAILPGARTLIPNTVYTLTFYVKAGTQAAARFGVWTSLGSFLTGTATIISGPGTTLGTTVVWVSNLTSEWTKVQFTFTSAASGTTDIYFYPVTSSASDPISGTNIIWGFQLELGSTPTEYQPITDFSTEFKSAFPNHTLYQDSNGVTPCTAAGDPVGLGIDQRQGGLVALGPELITNGDFATGDLTGWSATGSAVVTYSSGAMSIQRVVDAADRASQEIATLAAGSFCKIRFRVVENASSHNINVRLGTTAGGQQGFNFTTASAPLAGSYVDFIISTSVSASYFSIAPAANVTIVVDDISVKFLPGNHAYQATSGSRPILNRAPLGGRRNLLSESERFDQTYWIKDACGVAANQTTSPFGETTADKLTPDNTSAVHRLRVVTTTTTGEVYSVSVYAKAGEISKIAIREGNVTGAYASFDLSVGTVINQGSGGTGTIIAGSDGWYRCVVSFTAGASVRFDLIALPNTFASGDSPIANYTFNGTDSVYIFGAQLSEGDLSNYQRTAIAGTVVECSESGKPDCWFLELTGSKTMLTSTINFASWTQGTRKNLFSSTEAFGVTGWTLIRATVTANAAADYEGKLTADLAVVNTTDVNGSVLNGYGVAMTGNHTLSVEFKYNNSQWAMLRLGVARAWFDIQNGVVGTMNGAGAISRAIESLGNGWYRCFFTADPAGSNTCFIYPATNGDATDAGTLNQGSYVTRAQLELGTLTDYQRVGTDEMTVIFGARKVSDAAATYALELSSNYSTNAGAFAMLLPISAADNIAFAHHGDGAARSAIGSGFAAPTTRVVTGLSKIGVPSVSVRVDGALAAETTSSTGAGNYGNYPLYIGSRAGSSLFFNGQVYSVIARGKATPVRSLRKIESLASAQTSLMKPVIAGRPVISGDVAIGSTLTAIAGYVHGTRPLVTTWQWRRGNSEITGATSATYTIRTDDIGHQISVVQTETGYLGSQSLASAKTTAVPDWDPQQELFANNEVGVIGDIADMNRTKLSWRRNRARYSQQFDNAVWTKFNTTVVLSDEAAPDGTMTAFTLADTATSATHHIKHTEFSTQTVGVKCCRSYYVKKGTARFIAISPIDSFNFDENVLIFDFESGIFTNEADVNPSYIDGYEQPEHVGNGWWRLSFWNDGGQSGYGRIALAIYSSSNPLTGGSYSGVGSTVHIWGFQFEDGVEAPTDYQPIEDGSINFKKAFPNHVLYQDSFGVTPVTQVGDLVGLIVDKSKNGLDAVGPELIYDTTLTDALAWQIDGGSWTVGSGVFLCDNAPDAAQSRIKSPEILETGKWYLVEFEMTAHTGSGISIHLLPTAGSVGATIHGTFTGVGVYRSVVYNSGANTRLSFRVGGNAAPATATITSVSAKELPGNHIYQSTSGSRPSISRSPVGGRRNLLSESERFDQTYWVKSRAAVTANAAANPFGDLTADKILDSTDAGSHRIYSGSVTNAATQKVTFSCYLKSAELGYASLRVTDNTETDVSAILFNLSDGSQFSTSTAGTTITNPTSVITSLGDGWYRYALTVDVDSSETIIRGWIQLADNTPNSSYTGTGADGIFAWGAQFEVGSTATNYQRTAIAGTVVDCTEDGVDDCWYLDTTSNKWMQTSPLDFASWTGREARRNLLLDTESFNSWTLTSATLTSGVADPDGGSTAFTLTSTAPSGVLVRLHNGLAGPLTNSIWIRRRTGTGVVRFYTGNGSTTEQMQSVITSDWQRLSTATATASGANDRFGVILETSGDAVDIWHPQLETGSRVSNYQKPGTDEVMVVAGVQKLSDASVGCAIETSVNISSNVGAFRLLSPQTNATDDLSFASKGTVQSNAIATGFPAPVQMVMSGIGKIGSDISILRVDGVEAVSSAVDQGLADYGSFVAYIGSRGGTSLYLNGHLYSFVIRGKSPVGTTLRSAEEYYGDKTGLEF